MKKFLTIGAAVAALAAVPAAAQYGTGQYNNGQYNNGQYGTANVNANGAMGIQNRIAQLDARLQAGIQSGAISRAEAQSLRPQLRELRRLERQYSMNGLSQQERFDLQQRIRSVRQQLRMADNGMNGQYGAYDQDDYNQGGYNQGGYNQGGYGQGGYNQGGYGQGGPYQEVGVACRQGGGLGGVIGSIFGSNGNSDQDCGLRVGQQVSGGLSSLPSSMRYQFRDGNGIYHRTDGRYVYQIDARTNTVVRVYNR
jgi:hypothetical protein